MAYGVKVQLLVDNSTAAKSKFRQSIQELATKVTAGVPIKIKNVKLSLADGTKTELLTELREQLSGANLEIKIKHINAKPAIDNFRKDLIKMLDGLTISGVKDFVGQYSSGTQSGDTKDIDEVTEALENQRRAAEEAALAQRELGNVQKALNAIGKSIGDISDSERSAEQFAEYQRLGKIITEVRQLDLNAQRDRITIIQALVAALKQEIDAILAAEKAAKKKSAAAVEAAEDEARAAAKAAQEAKRQEDLSRRVISLRMRIEKYIESNSRAYKAYGNEFDTMLASLANEGNVSVGLLARLQKEFTNLQEKAYSANLEGQNFLGYIQSIWNKFSSAISVADVFRRAWETIKKMTEAVIELDTAMTELRKVTDLSGSEYISFFREASVIAKDVGATLSDTIYATADFSRLGYGIEDASNLAKVALMYKNVGDGVSDITVATESLISTMKAFNIEAIDSMQIVDAFNEVGNNFAITSTGIGEALQRSASSLAAAGNTMEESIGLITAMNSVIQNPETVGTTIKTISMYLRAAKTEAEDAGVATDGMAKSVSALRNQLMKLTSGTSKPLDIMLDSDTFKSTYQIIEELSEIWGELSDTTQANIMNLIGGKRNANAISALISNFEDAKAAAEAAFESTGSAAIENAAYLDSIAGKIEQLKAKFEELSSNVVNNALVKWILDVANALMNAANSLSKLGSGVTKVSAIATAFKMLYSVFSNMKSRTSLAGLFSELKQTGVMSDVLQNKFSALSVTEKILAERMILHENALSGVSAAQRNAALGLVSVTSGTAKAATAMSGIGKATEIAAVGFKNFGTAIKQAFKSNWVLLVITAVFEAVSWVVNKIQEAKREAIEAVDEITGNYSSAVANLASNKKSLNGLKDQFDKLAKGVSESGENISLTANEYETYLSIVDQIIDISPDVVKRYDEEGKAIVNYTTLLNDAIASQEELFAQKQLEYLGSGGTLFEGTKYKYDEAQKSLSNAGKEAQDAIWNAIYDLDFDDQFDALNAYVDALKAVGIELADEKNPWLYTADEFEKLYDGADRFINILKAAKDADGDELFSAHQINAAKLALAGMADEAATLSAIVKDQTDYLQVYAKTTDWYKLMPAEAWDEFAAGIKNVNDPFASVLDNMKALDEYGTAFAKVIAGDAGQDLLDKAKLLKSGLISVEEYNTAVKETLAAMDEESVVLAALGEYFYSFSNYAPIAADGVHDVITEVMGLTAALERMKNGTDILDKALNDMASGKGLSYDTFKSIVGLLDEGESISDYIVEENGLLTLNAEAWEARSESIIESDKKTLRDNRSRLIDEDNVLRNLTAELEREYAALSQLEATIRQKLRDLEQQINANNTAELEREYAALSQSRAATRQELRNLEQQINANNSAIAYNNAEIERYTNELIMYDAALNTFAANNSLDFKDTISEMQEASNGAKNLLSALDALKSGEMLGYDEMLNLSMEYNELFSNGFFDAKTADEQEAAIRSVLNVYNEMYRTAIDARIAILETAKSDAELNGEEWTHIQAAIDSLKEISGNDLEISFPTGKTEEAVDSYTKLTNSVNDAKDALSLLKTVNDDGLAMDSILKLVEMARENEWSLSSMFEFDDKNNLAVNKDFITKYVDSLIDGMSEIPGMTDELETAFSEMLYTAIKTEEAVVSLEDSYKNALSAAEGFDGVSAGAELSYEIISELIKIDTRYADAIEYVNGRLTINRDKYDEITESVLKKTAAEAKAAAAEIEYSEEYLDLMNRRGSLNSDEQQRLDNLNAQIASYAVLASEIQNANAAYQQFMNADDAVSGDQYEAAQKAYETIRDTLYDKESELFGKVGRDQFREGVEFLVKPGIDEDSPEWDAAWKRVQRYMKDGVEGVENFYEDLISKGFIDKTTGRLDADLYEVSEKLGISVDMTRALFEELSTYSKEGFKYDVDTAPIDDAAKSAQATKTPMQELNDQIDAAQKGTNALDDAIDGLNDADLSPIENKFGNLSNAVSELARRLHILANTRYSVNVAMGNLPGKSFAPAVAGMASASGTRKAVGGKTLVGELGMEMVVDPSTNRWYTVGEQGAEFTKLPKNAIVFNAEQTKKLLGAGRISGQGESMAAGNLFSAIAKDDGDSIIGKIVGAVSDIGKTVSDAAKKAAKQALISTKKQENVNGDTSGINFGSYGSSGKGSSGGGSSEKELTILEQLKEKYEEVNAQTEHLIEHQEHLYNVSERGLNFDGMEDSLAKQAELYKQIMDNSQAAVKEMIANGATDADEELQDMERAYWSAYNSMHEALDQINSLYVDALNDQIDNIQTAYGNLSNAAEEFNAHNGITVDTFQALLEHGIEYLGLLDNVNGQYTINRDAIDKMIAAEKEQLTVQSALSYMSKIQSALTNGDTNALNAFIDASQQVGDSTWDAVYAQAELLKTMGLTGDQYTKIINNINAAKALSDSVITDLMRDLDEVDQETVESYDTQIDALDRILEFTKDLIKYETEERIDAINEQIDAYKKIIDLKKESLKTTKDESKYEDEVASKVSEIAALQAKIDLMSLDSSREAQAERAKMMEEMAELQLELSEYQNDHAYDAQMNTLDKMSASYEDSRQAEIEQLEASVSSEEKVYQAAIERISSRWDTLYSDLIKWNTEAGNSLNSEITENWNIATEAVAKYGSYLAALNGYKTLNAAGSIASPATKSTVVASTLPKYHSGGVVGSTGTDEVLAVLEKGELVLDNEHKNALYRFIDFGKALAERLGKTVGSMDLPIANFVHALSPINSHGNIDGAKSIVFSPSIKVEINHNGSMSDSDADRFGNRIASTALDKLKEAFSSRGIIPNGAGI